MQTNHLLFGVIALLMLAIVWVGVIDLTDRTRLDASALDAVSAVQPTTTPAALTETATRSPASTNTKPVSVLVKTQAPGTYTFAQVAAHNSSSSCYTVVSGSVYNLTSFISQHPGGSVILSMCGKDGTSAFLAQHEGQRRPESELASLKIGTLVQ